MEPINKLIHHLSKLPGIGEKTATRLAFFILQQDNTYAKDLSASLIDVKEKIRFCSRCMNLTERDPCTICAHPKRDAHIVCVVEDPSDLLAIERTGIYRGLYHVLHGALSPLDGIGPNDIKIKELLSRLGDGTVQEIIIATNPSVEGEATSLYISRIVKPIGIKITRIASGIPMGGDLDYIDSATLARALEARREI